MSRRSIVFALFMLAFLAVVALVAFNAGLGEAPERGGIPETTTSWTPPPTRAPSQSPTPTESPRPAADGTDYEACFDGECEVLVTEESVEIAMDPELPPEISSVLIQNRSGDVSVNCESERLAACHGWFYFLPPGDDVRFDTTVGLVIDMDRYIGGSMVVTFSLEG